MEGTMRVSAVTVVVVAVVTTLRTAGAMSCSNSWIEDETPYPVMRRVNVTALAALADEFLRADGPTETAAAAVDVQLRMNRRSAVSARLNKACGYELRVNGTGAVSRSAYLPAYERAVCGDGHVYRMQFVRPGGTHRQTVRLPDGAAPVASVELLANGKNHLTVDSVCVSLRGGGVVGGARAFCVDLELLKSCWCLQAGRGDGARPLRRSDYYLGFDGILLAMSKWNVRTIVFRDVGALADGFGALARDPTDANAQDAVCGRVELVPGELDADLDSCPVEKRYAVEATTSADDVADGPAVGGGGTPSFEFRPERMDIIRLLYTCAPRSDGTAVAGVRRKPAVDHGHKSGARTSSSSFTRTVYLFFWSVALYVVSI